MIAALFVESGGSYFGLKDVDPWDEARDARRYAGTFPVVAHPPCQRWGKFWAGQPLWIARTGERKQKGDDGGCFSAALESVRRVGGVLEHPWGSHAWPHFGIAVPQRCGGWVKADEYGGYTCCVEQGRYGHYARKPTLLYAVGTALPELRWGKSAPVFPQWAIDKYGLEKCKRAGELAFKGGGKDNTHRIETPPEFRELLLAIAATAKAPNAPGIRPSRGRVPASARSPDAAPPRSTTADPSQLESTPGKNGLEAFESSDDDIARWAIEAGALYKICIDARDALIEFERGRREGTQP